MKIGVIESYNQSKAEDLQDYREAQAGREALADLEGTWGIMSDERREFLRSLGQDV